MYKFLPIKGVDTNVFLYMYRKTEIPLDLERDSEILKTPKGVILNLKD